MTKISTESKVLSLADGMVLAIEKDVSHQIGRYRRFGGARQKSADKVHQLIGSLMDAGREALKNFKTTHHGESRLKNCVKYDLGDGCRLITIQDNKMILLAYFGDHDECDKWLEAHRGHELARLVTGDAKLLPFKTQRNSDELFKVTRDTQDLSLTSRLKEDSMVYLTKDLGASAYKIIKKIESLTTFSSENDLCDAVSQIEDDFTASLLLDVLNLLRAGDVDGAEQRILLDQGKVKLVRDLSDDEVMEIADGDRIKLIRIGDEFYQRLWKEKANSENYFDWFFFMHPEQERQVEMEFDGPAALSGVSGSGKTCIAVKRAVKLAQRHPHKKVLVITLNRSLSNMIDKLISAAITKPDTKNRIHVTSLFEFLKTILIENDQHNSKSYNDETWKLDEHIDEVFREFYRCELNFKEAEILLPLHRSLVSQGIDGEQYIREEFDWIRSALSQTERERYLKITRSGRKYPLMENRRASILKGLNAWERKMQQIGIIDYLGLTSAVTKILDKLKPIYDHVIIDEAQDFGTTELKILRQLTKEGPNDIYLCGDLAQHILPKKQLLVEAGIDIKNREYKIRKNYRNTREILNAAYNILYDNLDDGSLESGELAIQDPDLSNVSGEKPIVLSAPNLALEIYFARVMAQSFADDNRKSCIAIVGFSLLEIRRFGKEIGIPVLDGTADFLQSNIVLGDLEQTKGYEFDAVFILNASKEMVPPQYVPHEELYRFGSQFYVAMTRAKQQLFISHSGEPSDWLRSAEDLLHFDEWTAYVGNPPPSLQNLPVPQKLREFSDPIIKIQHLTGRQFNYTPYARSLSLNVLEKLDDLVNGEGLVRGNKRQKWKNIGTYYESLKGRQDSQQAKYLSGDAVFTEASQRFERIFSGESYYSSEEPESTHITKVKGTESEEKKLGRKTEGVRLALNLKEPVKYPVTKIKMGQQIAVENNIKDQVRGGEYWIFHDEDTDLIAEALTKVGFGYVRGKGWSAK